MNSIEYRTTDRGLYRISRGDQGRINGADGFSRYRLRFTAGAYTRFVGPDAVEGMLVNEVEARRLFEERGGNPADFDL